jgi:hypothetical protein
MGELPARSSNSKIDLSGRSSVWNGHGRCQDLRFIRIPDLDDMPVGRAIGQSEEVGPRRQHVPGDFHRIAEGNNGLSALLIRFDRPERV